MKNFVRLLLCLCLSVFAVARAISPSKALKLTAKTAQKKETGEKADAKTLLHDAKKSDRRDDQERASREGSRSKKTEEQTVLEIRSRGSQEFERPRKQVSRARATISSKGSRTRVKPKSR